MVNASKEELKTCRDRVNPIKDPVKTTYSKSARDVAAMRVRDLKYQLEIDRIARSTDCSELLDYDLEN